MTNEIRYLIEYRHDGIEKRADGTTYSPDGNELFMHVSDLTEAGAEVWKIRIHRPLANQGLSL
jgi:hypothetical protein